jgi:hypothetical protein
MGTLRKNTERDVIVAAQQYKLPFGASPLPEPMSGGGALAEMHVLITALKWFASISGIAAALMVSLDSGRRVTGWGFVVFVASALAWIAGAALSHDWALGTQNVALFAIDVFGVYRYLVRKKPV